MESGWGKLHPRRRNRSEDSADAVLTSLEAALTRIDDSDDESQFIVPTWRDVDTGTEGHGGQSVRARIADVASPVASAFSTVPASNGALEAAHRHVTVDSVPGIVLDSMLVPSNESDEPLVRSREPSVSLLDALEEDLVRPVRRRRARRVCDSGCDVQSVRTRCRFHVLSSEDEDEDRPLEPCVSQVTHVDAAPTQVDDAVDVFSGDSVNSTVGDAREVQAETMRRPTVRRLVLVPQVGDHTPQSIQDRFSQSSGTAELLEEAPDPHSGPSDAEGALLSSVNDTESLGDGQSDFDGEEESAAPEPEPIREDDHARVTPAIREGLRSLDHVDLVHLFSIRAVVMKAYRAATRCPRRDRVGSPGPE